MKLGTTIMLLDN